MNCHAHPASRKTDWWPRSKAVGGEESALHGIADTCAISYHWKARICYESRTFHRETALVQALSCQLATRLQITCYHLIRQMIEATVGCKEFALASTWFIRCLSTLGRQCILGGRHLRLNRPLDQWVDGHMLPPPTQIGRETSSGMSSSLHAIELLFMFPVVCFR